LSSNCSVIVVIAAAEAATVFVVGVFCVCASFRCWLFRSWGRVGTTIGNNKLESFGSKVSAIQAFRTLYAEKTGNDWDNRKNFVKVPNRFYPLDIDYGADDDKMVKLDDKAGSRSSLPEAIQKLIRLIFDIESMKKAMLEFEVATFAHVECSTIKQLKTVAVDFA